MDKPSHSRKTACAKFRACISNIVLTRVAFVPPMSTVEATTIPFTNPALFTDLQTLINQAFRGAQLRGTEVACKAVCSQDEQARPLTELELRAVTQVCSTTTVSVSAGLLLALPVTGLMAVLQGSLVLARDNAELLHTASGKDQDRSFLNGTVCVTIEACIRYQLPGTMATGTPVTSSPLIFTGSQCITVSPFDPEQPLCFNMPISTDQSLLSVTPIPPVTGASPSFPSGLPPGTLLSLEARLALSSQLVLAQCSKKK